MVTRLRPSFDVTLYPGTGLPPDQVQLQPTNIQPYIDNPELAQLEADVTKARYGGSSIQESPGGTPPFMEPSAEKIAQARDFSNRTGFEQSVFKQIGGNPFEIDVMAKVDKVSNAQLPDLFKQVFGNQVTWEDRANLNPKQAAHWQTEINKFRAYTKEMVESEKKTKIDMYNNLMKRFDNEAKEQEASLKKVKEREKEWMQTQKTATKEHTDLRKEKTQLLKRMTELATEGYGPGQTATTTESMTELADIQNRIQEINSQLYAPQRAISTEHEEKKLAEKKGPISKTGSKTMNQDQIQTRYNELRRKGYTPGQAKEQLKKEGIEIS